MKHFSILKSDIQGEYTYEVYYIGNLSLLAAKDWFTRQYSGVKEYNTGEDYLFMERETVRDSVTQSGSVFYYVDGDTYESNTIDDVYLYTSADMKVKRLSDELIPDNILRVSDDLIVKSSTADSTKKFKITVDDSGTITATEVTE